MGSLCARVRGRRRSAIEGDTRFMDPHRPYFPNLALMRVARYSTVQYRGFSTFGGMSLQQKQARVGQHIRDEVIPSGMSVKEAAARLGVGRPALSNLLNGKASLSPKMALRLERAFGADGNGLLELQASHDKALRRDEEKGVAVRGYVPSFLTITAHDIERWADTNGAREGLPVLLRKLVHATGRDLVRVDFPGFDNSQRPGWDGWIEAGTATAWIPEGMSG